MGVSIGWYPNEPESRWITVGGRSMMHQLLLDNNLYGALAAEDVPLLLELGRRYPGTDIQRAFRAFARAIRRHGVIVVIFEL